MKKLLFALFATAALFSVAEAQTSTGTTVYMKTSLASSSLSDTGDIITNATDTARFYLNAENFTNGQIQINTFAISGTAPIVTAFLETSIDGKKWYKRQTSLQVNGDTANLTPVTEIADSDGLTFTITNVKYYRVSIHGHKTQSVGLKCLGYLRKDNN